MSIPKTDRFADTFAACGGLQCGFCIPGIVMRAKAHIDKKGAALARDDMARHLGAHLCRCTGYVKVLDAIGAVAKGEVCTPVLSGAIGGREVGLGRKESKKANPASQDPVLRSMDEGDAYDLDEIAERSGVDRMKLLPRLLELELAGAVRRVDGGRFVTGFDGPC